MSAAVKEEAAEPVAAGDESVGQGEASGDDMGRRGAAPELAEPSSEAGDAAGEPTWRAGRAALMASANDVQRTPHRGPGAEQ